MLAPPPLHAETRQRRLSEAPPAGVLPSDKRRSRAGRVRRCLLVPQPRAALLRPLRQVPCERERRTQGRYVAAIGRDNARGFLGILDDPISTDLTRRYARSVRAKSLPL